MERETGLRELIIGVGPIIAVLICIVVVVFRHNRSKPHGLNKRGSGGTHFFGGPWTDYSLRDDRYHPDFEPEERNKRAHKRRKRKRPKRD
jgi:hypothetical protein